MNGASIYEGRRVMVTGSAGFKGRWLVRALRELGAQVFEVDTALPGPRGVDVTGAYFHVSLGVAQPEIIFHLAAQALVPVGYEDPWGTWDTNVAGTLNLLEGLRESNHPCAAVIVTSDKVYGDTGERFATEETPFAPRCPYSASKVGVELAVDAYRTAFYAPRGHRIAVATARAGNVIGGGDFGRGRLVPNAIRALAAGKPIPIFNPAAVRPWQYVEDVIDGYLQLGQALLYTSEADGDPSPFQASFCSAWNFGPPLAHTVLDVAHEVIAAWGSGTTEITPTDLHEVTDLRIDSTKAQKRLGWMPRWSFAEGVKAAVAWYRQHPREVAP